MTGRSEHLRLVCETAVEWAGEYGFSAPDAARQVILAVYALDPDALDSQNREWAASEDASATPDGWCDRCKTAVWTRSDDTLMSHPCQPSADAGAQS